MAHYQNQTPSLVSFVLVDRSYAVNPGERCEVDDNHAYLIERRCLPLTRVAESAYPIEITLADFEPQEPSTEYVSPHYDGYQGCFCPVCKPKSRAPRKPLPKRKR
jgi:hypothetical protein